MVDNDQLDLLMNIKELEEEKKKLVENIMILQEKNSRLEEILKTKNQLIDYYINSYNYRNRL